MSSDPSSAFIACVTLSGLLNLSVEQELLVFVLDGSRIQWSNAQRPEHRVSV